MLKKTESLENENTNKKHESGKAKASSTPRNTAAQACVSFVFGGHFSRIFGGGPFFAPSAASPLTSFSQSLPACLMPEPFIGLRGFEDYLGHFNTAAYLYGWNRHRSHSYQPQYFALRLKDNALQFFSTLSENNQHDINTLEVGFCQNYTTNVEISKIRRKLASQESEQNIGTFVCHIRTLARRAYRNQPYLFKKSRS